MKREEIKNQIKNLCKLELKELNETEAELFTKYHLEETLTETDKINLSKFYLNSIEENKTEINKKIDTSKIERLISFVSLSPINSESILDENILNKNIRIFPNLKEFILLYSKESENAFITIKERYSDINVVGIPVNFNTSPTKLNKLTGNILGKGNISKENTIIDITLGMKFVTIFFYKFAVENNITAINWFESQLNTYELKEDSYEIIRKNLFKRIPATSNLKIMIEPRKENVKIYNQINESIKNFDFKSTESYYNKIGNKNLEIFFRELSKIYSLENMITLNPDKFFQDIESSLEILTEELVQDEDSINKIRRYLISLASLIIYEDFDDSNEENYSEIEKRNFFWFDKFLRKFSLEKKEIEDKAGVLIGNKVNIFYYLAIQFLEIKFNNSQEYATKLFVKKFKENIIFDINPKFNSKEKENIKIILNDSKALKEFIFEYDIDEELKELLPTNIFRESINGDFYFKNFVLIIEKFDLSINTKEYESLSFVDKKGFSLLKYLLENPLQEISGKVLFSKIVPNESIEHQYCEEENEDNEKENAKKISNRFKRNLSTVKNKIKDFNENIKFIAEENGIIIEDIIIYEKSKTITESDFAHSIKINPNLYTIV